MDPLLSLSCPDAARRHAITDALSRAGLEVTDAGEDLATLYITDDADGLVIRNTDEPLIQLSVAIPPDEIAGLARLGLELTTVWGLLRSIEDSESFGVIAAHVAHDARNALVPMMFAAEALALDHPSALELTELLVEGCDRVTSVLARITSVERAGVPAPTCANTVITDLGTTLRAIARRAKLVTRLESPLPLAGIERSDLERVLLILVANAAEASRDAARIVVTTRSRLVKRLEAREAPAGDWVVVTIEDDGTSIDDAARDRALHPTFVAAVSALSSGVGLPSVAQIARAAAGHVFIDNEHAGTKVSVWLPTTS